MAVTWRGSIVTPQLQAGNVLNGNVVVFAIVNTFRSRAKIDILRLVCQFDNSEAPTGGTANRVMPIMRARKCAAVDVSGGVKINARNAWDSNLNAADSGIEILFNAGTFGGPDTVITAANRGAPMWNQYTMRQASAIEQVLSQDNFCVPALSANKDLILNVGEALIIEQQAAIPTGGVAWFNLAWEEDTIDAGYVVGGEVNLSASPVSGAKVLLVTDSTVAMTNPSVETLTTNGSGLFSKTLASDVKAAVFVQHESGGTQYSDEGKPFIEKP